jgi:hypothetical protein
MDDPRDCDRIFKSRRKKFYGGENTRRELCVGVDKTCGGGRGFKIYKSVNLKRYS